MVIEGNTDDDLDDILYQEPDGGPGCGPARRPLQSAQVFLLPDVSVRCGRPALRSDTKNLSMEANI